MYEQLRKVVMSNPFSTIYASISSNNFVNSGDENSWNVNSAEDQQNTEERIINCMKYSLLKKPAQSHSTQEQLYSTSSLPTIVSSYGNNLLGKQSRLVSLTQCGFVAMLITRWIVIVERYLKAEFPGFTSSCLSCLFHLDWLLLEDMNTWSLEVGNSFILFFFSVPCAMWLVSFKGITQHLADI